MARIGSDPTEAVATFLATVNKYQSLDALTRGQSEEEARLQDLRSQVVEHVVSILLDPAGRQQVFSLSIYNLSLG